MFASDCVACSQDKGCYCEWMCAGSVFVGQPVVTPFIVLGDSMVEMSCMQGMVCSFCAASMPGFAKRIVAHSLAVSL